MLETLVFVLGSAIILGVSWKPLHQPDSHGFYRFFAWEAICGLFALNVQTWFTNPFAWYQLISWILLIVSLVPIIYGVLLLRNVGKPTDALEATTRLVTTGIYHYIRHPLYASLLYLAWGIFFKSPSLVEGLIAAVATAFLYTTARADEGECLIKFGPEYASYMKQTKMFVPLVM
jgi:protein-S-isoprenylcysteine O-methyltransferase Ste14